MPYPGMYTFNNVFFFFFANFFKKLRHFHCFQFLLVFRFHRLWIFQSFCRCRHAGQRAATTVAHRWSSWVLCVWPSAFCGSDVCLRVVSMKLTIDSFPMHPKPFTHPFKPLVFACRPVAIPRLRRWRRWCCPRATTIAAGPSLKSHRRWTSQPVLKNI